MFHKVSEGCRLVKGEGAKQILRELGLSAYEVNAYSALLEGGQMTAMEISKKGNVPYSKIYGVLNELKDKSWVKSTESRPTKYFPLPPLEALATARLRFEDRFKAWEPVVANELQSVYEKRELVERPDIVILHGQQGVISKLEEMLKKASREVVVAAPEFSRAMIGPATVLLGQFLKARVGTKFMVTGEIKNWKSLKDLVGVAEMRARDSMFGGGIIIDGKEAMLFLGEDKPSLVIWSNHVGLVQFARDYFQFLWDSSRKVEL